jgi:hypothetical protein
MNFKPKSYKVSSNLYDLTEQQVAILDHEATDGNGWAFYCNSYISHPTVFVNKISGRFQNFNEDDHVEIRVDDKQITTSCSTCRRGEICVHCIALLYCWVYDNDSFTNVADSIKELQGRDKTELIEIIARMLVKDFANLELVNEKSDDDDDDYDLDGLLN